MIKIVRLKDGSDVISEVTIKKDSAGQYDTEVELTLPMMFSLVNQSLVLQHWLPLAVMKGNSVMLSLDEVICIMEPNEDFKEYYETAVKKVTSVLNKKEKDLEEMMEALDELENTKGIRIH